MSVIIKMEDLKNSSICMDASESVSSNLYRLAMLIHVILTTIGLVSTAVALVYLRKKLYFHKNINILIVFMFCSSTALSLQMLVMQLRHLYTSFFHKDPCDAFVPSTHCFPYLIINALSIACMTGAQVCMCLERIVATILMKKYQQWGGTLGYTMVAITLGIFCCLIYSIYFNTPLDEYNLTCIAIPSKAANASNIMFIVLIFFNILSILASILINMVNKKCRNRLRFNLADRYQVEENVGTTRYIFIIVSVQFVILTFYGTCTLLLRTYKKQFDEKVHRTLIMFVYAVPYFTCALPIMMMLIVRNGTRRRTRNITKMVSTSATGTTGRDNYFEELLKQWA